jgi:membrane associated rhomboid family serine protease
VTYPPKRFANHEETVNPERPPAFPWAEVQVVAFLVLVHLGLAFWAGGPFPPGRELIERGALIGGSLSDEPWRLLSSLFLHSGPSHVLWNGLSMLVFAVPLLSRLGYGRTGLIYAASGLGGGFAAVSFAPPGALIIGSSGAVAGLFGAWVVLTLRQSRHEPLGRRARFRTLGVALLVLPSLINPTTAAGRPVSVSAHLGGLFTGMLIGAVLSLGMAHPAGTDDEDDEEAFPVIGRPPD